MIKKDFLNKALVGISSARDLQEYSSSLVEHSHEADIEELRKVYQSERDDAMESNEVILRPVSEKRILIEGVHKQ
jgi:hypothetical protein